jgi:hypothetical protein
MRFIPFVGPGDMASSAQTVTKIMYWVHTIDVNAKANFVIYKDDGYSYPRTKLWDYTTSELTATGFQFTSLSAADQFDIEPGVNYWFGYRLDHTTSSATSAKLYGDEIQQYGYGFGTTGSLTFANIGFYLANNTSAMPATLTGPGNIAETYVEYLPRLWMET